MKLIIQNRKIAGTATDKYQGDEITMDAPEDFDMEKLSDYQIIDGQAIIPSAAPIVEETIHS